MSKRLPRITSTEALKALRKAGWYSVRQKGSHIILKNDNNPKSRVIVPMHPGDVLLPKTMASILEQAGLTVDEFKNLL